ncbi:hypothetical protein Hanom_Chr04g00328441 [Helianthus anomalus]
MHIHYYFNLQMASMFNILSCFSETSRTGKFVCDGDVCVLRKHESGRGNGSMNLKKSQKKQGSLKVPYFSTGHTKG